ncbi:hypothetical protein LJK88_33215 [Paenibacillus sp. P26]|nr:hypothetical protein LJK88_33215 [Paenibacillus sp. P26]
MEEFTALTALSSTQPAAGGCRQRRLLGIIAFSANSRAHADEPADKALVAEANRP